MHFYDWDGKCFTSTTKAKLFLGIVDSYNAKAFLLRDTSCADGSPVSSAVASPLPLSSSAMTPGREVTKETTKKKKQKTKPAQLANSTIEGWTRPDFAAERDSWLLAQLMREQHWIRLPPPPPIYASTSLLSVSSQEDVKRNAESPKPSNVTSVAAPEKSDSNNDRYDGEELLSVSIRRDAATGTFGFTVVEAQLEQDNAVVETGTPPSELCVVVDKVLRHDVEHFPLRPGDCLLAIAVMNDHVERWLPITSIETLGAALHTSDEKGLVSFKLVRASAELCTQATSAAYAEAPSCNPSSGNASQQLRCTPVQGGVDYQDDHEKLSVEKGDDLSKKNGGYANSSSSSSKNGSSSDCNELGLHSEVGSNNDVVFESNNSSGTKEAMTAITTTAQKRIVQQLQQRAWKRQVFGAVLAAVAGAAKVKALVLGAQVPGDTPNVN